MKRIELTQGRFTIVDDCDYERLADREWGLHNRGRSGGTGYAARWVTDAAGKRSIVMMHREILDAPDELTVDHINGNGLDNRRQNLRLATQQEQTFNRPGWGKSKYKGVDQKNGRWRARIRLNGHQQHLGYFDNEEEAASAYDRDARRLHGEFARVNFPTIDEQSALLASSQAE